LRCSDCGSARTEIPPGTAEHQDLYFKDYWGAESDRAGGGLSHALTGIFLRQRVRAISGELTKDSEVLDYGCGNGEFVGAMRAAGYNCYGFEPNSGLRSGHINSRVKDRTYDMVTLWHVFEHFTDPGGELAGLAALLKPSGKIFLSVPNFQSADARLGGPLWFHLDVPRHACHYTQLGLERLIRRCGLKVISARKPFNWYAVFGMYQTLLNTSGCTTNALYYWLKRGRSVYSRRSMAIAVKDALLHAVLAVPYLAAAFALTAAVSLFGRAGSLEIICEKQ